MLSKVHGLDALFNKVCLLSLAVLSAVVVNILVGVAPVHAGLNNTGPSDAGSGNLRYNLSLYGTHTYTHLVIPVYYRYNPGTVQVKSDFVYSVGGAKVSFNGGPAHSGLYYFNIGGFYYDSSSGLYKSVITADLRSADGGTNWSERQLEVYQFRMRLMNPSDGWIAYGGGRVSQADDEYYRWNPNGDKSTRGSDQVMYMALPCDHTQPESVTVRFWDLDQPSSSSPALNGGRDIRVTITDETAGRQVANYFGPDHRTEMGENGTLNVPITMEPGHQYRIDVTNIWVGNLIEYELPYDNISYATGCWEADGATRVKLNNGEWKTGRNAIQGVRPIGGNVATWNHRVWNSSQWDMPQDIQMSVREWTEGVNPGRNNIIKTAYGRGGPGVTFFDWSDNHTVVQADVGGLMCQNVTWDPSSYDVAHAGTSEEACISVPYHYPSCDDPNDPDCKDPYPYPSDPGGDCTFEGGCDDGDKPTQAVNTNTNSDKDEVMTGEDVTFTYNIWNDRGPTKTKDIEYHVYAFLLKGGADLPDNAEDSVIYPLGANTGCYGRDVDGNGYVDGRCQQVASGGTGELSPGNSVKPTQKFTILENWLGQPGDQICSYVVLGATWNVYDGVNSGTQLASNIKCVKIGKRPQIQINGSDSYANKGFTGSKYSDIELNYQRGSYSQYGLLTGSSGSSNFGSAGYTFSKSSNASKACQLGWANLSSAYSGSFFNCSGTSLAAANLTHTFYNAVTVTDTTSYPGSLSSLSSPSGGGTSYYQASGGTNFSGNLNPGTRAVVYVNGDANITGNIIAYGAAGVSGNLPANPDAGGSTNNLNQTFTNLVDIPSLTIVATGDININGSVTTIDANLVSKNGRVITCAGSDGGGTKTELGIGSTQCANKLKINGAVASKESPILHRIFGAGNTIDATSNTNQWNNLMNSSSSEWFNYTPNVWLTPYLNGGGDTPNNYTTVQVTNLPVRY